MSDLITQAQAAATQANWSAVALLLHRFLVEAEPNAAQASSSQLLNLAIQVLQAGDFQEQWEVAKVFPLIGQPAIAPLMTLLEDDTAELEARWFAARILGNLNDPVAIIALVNQLQTSEDEDLSQMVAEALANLGTPAIAALTHLLDAPDTRQFAVQALAQIRQVETVSPLLSVAQDENPAVRAIAIEALSSFHDPRISDVLVAAVTDPVAAVRKVAIASLGARTDLGQRPDLVNVLADQLWDINLSVCQQAALTLGKLKQDEAVPLLFRALVAQTPLPLQLDLVRALSWIGTRPALESLQSCLQVYPASLSLPIYQEILLMLGRWETAELKAIAAQILANTLTSGSAIILESALRRTLATALGELKHPATLEPLIQLLADADAGVRLHAIAALRALNPTTVYTYLEELQSRPNLPEHLRAGIDIAFNEWKTELSL
jgi:HEAT repeat protein